MTYFGPCFGGINRGWYRRTSDPTYAEDRDRIDGVWSPACDEILERYLRKYGTFFTAFASEIMQLVEAKTGSRLLHTSRYYDYYIANCAFEVPRLKALWRESHEEEQKLRRMWECTRCHARNLLVAVHPHLIAKQGLPPPLCWDCWKSKCAKEKVKRAALGGRFSPLAERFLSEAQLPRTCESCGCQFTLDRDSQLLTEGMLEVGSYSNACLDYLYPNLFVSTCPTCFRAILQDYSEGTTKERKARLQEFAAFTGKIPPQDFPNLCYVAHDRDSMARFLDLLRVLRTPEGYAFEYGSFPAALIRMGLMPEAAMRTSFGTVVLAKDGHLCYSLVEKEIDDYLTSRRIVHRKEVTYPDTSMRADWELELADGSRVLVEYFGLMDIPSYRRKAEFKLDLAAQRGLELVPLYPTSSWRVSLEESLRERT